MITTTKTPLINADALPFIDPVRIEKPLKSSISIAPNDLPDRLSTPVLHKRQQQKRVRFASKLDFLKEESLLSSGENSPSPTPKSNTRIVDPWRQHGQLYGAYVDYLENNNKVTTNDIEIRQIPPPVPPPPPPSEPGAYAPTYRHTFVIQSKSPELVIDSITISAPSPHLPRIVQRTKSSAKQPISTVDYYVKQHLQLSTPPTIVHGRKITNSSNQKYPDISAHTNSTAKRTIITMPPVNIMQPNRKSISQENLFRPKFMNDSNHTKRTNTNLPKPMLETKNEIYHFAERSILPTYSKKPATPGHALRRQDTSIVKAPPFFQNQSNEHLFQPVIHTTH